MKIFFLLLILVSFAGIANSQGIKMKIATITPAEGEDVIAFETSDTTANATSPGGGGGTGKTRLELVKIKKLVGASTNELFKRSLVGSHLADVTFEFSNSNSQLFYKIVLRDVLIGHFSYLSPECPGCSKMFHQVWFDYAKIEMTDVATGITVGFDKSLNKVY